MIVVLAWRRGKLQAAKRYLHAVPLTIGISLAFAGIPFYSGTTMICTIPTPPRAKSWIPVTWIQLIPVFTSLALCTIMVLPILFKVREHTADFKKQTAMNDIKTYDNNLNLGGFGKSKATPKLTEAEFKRFDAFQQAERAVMWQAILYVSAIYISWVLRTIVDITWHNMSRNGRYSLVILVLLLLPLQGFMNACNYFRPRIAQYLRRKSHGSQRHASSSTSDDEVLQNEILSSEQHRGSLIESDHLVASDILVDPSAYLEVAPMYENLLEGDASEAADQKSRLGDLGSVTMEIDRLDQIPEESSVN